MSIGLKGSGCDVELITDFETDKAYQVVVEDTGEIIWMPKSAFDEHGILTDWGEKILTKNLEAGE